MITDRNIKMPAWDATDPATVNAWKQISSEYAEGASGDVHVVLGSSLRPGNIWEASEFGTLNKQSKYNQYYSYRSRIRRKNDIMDQALKITNNTRAAIDFTYNGKQYTLAGEAYLRGYGSPDFVAYMGSLSDVGPPKRRATFRTDELGGIQAALTEEMKHRMMTIEFEP